ncbi:MAG: NAD(P)-binding protein [Sterolibacteriaceae bacterium]|nr:NAD(P)-binding protein [Sterolibacteriaceae bacterium]
MDRRNFLLAAGVTGAAAASGAGFWRWLEFPTEVRSPGRQLGHLLRDRQAIPPPRAHYRTDVLILGSGAAGLTAAWRLAKSGHARFMVVGGPEPRGNLASGIAGEARYPTGAHYLPLPSRESTHIREMLEDLGIILDGAQAERPYYDERHVVHAPESRLLIDGVWHDGVLPASALPAAGSAEHQRFFSYVDELALARGSDGKRAFAMPIAASSADASWRALDALSFAAWLKREGYRSAALRWYLDYTCRDDYGRGADQVSAYAGLHYFASRAGDARNAERGAVLTWPAGLGALADRLAQAAGLIRADRSDARPAPRLLEGTAVSLRQIRAGVEALCVTQGAGGLESYVVTARRAICAMPLHAAGRVVEAMQDFGFDPGEHLPTQAPWLVSNFVLSRFPAELPGATLAWDNIVLGSSSLGYVVSTHQDLRVGPPPRTVFTAYHALAEMSPGAAREWMTRASPAELLELASADLRTAYGWKLAACCERAEITLRGHGMAVPAPGYLSNRGLQALREADGCILFAHGDLSGYSVFEEAAWWGDRCARRICSA